MTMTKIPDIAFEIDGDLLSLEQDQGCGQVASIDLHRIHLEHIATLMGLRQESNMNKAIIDRTRRNMIRLRDKIEDLSDLLESVPCFPPGGAPTEDVALVRDLLGMADDHLDELDDVLTPQEDLSETGNDKEQASSEVEAV